MGLAEGGISYCTYYVDGELPEDYRQLYVQRIGMHGFEKLTPEAEADSTSGWVPIDDIVGQTFQTGNVFLNQYLVLALRIDKWAIPPLLVKAALKNAERGIKEEQGREHLSRMERGELLDRERARLKRRTLPAVRVVDLCWNLDTNEMRFASASRPVNELFSDLFEKTFGMRLLPANPYISALQCGLPDDLVGRLADVEPAPLLGE